jgi:HSP20 family molecular chaperone IbpA
LRTHKEFDVTAILTPNRPLYTARTATRSIPVDLYREGDNYIVTADLPGIDPTTVDIDGAEVPAA